MLAIGSWKETWAVFSPSSLEGTSFIDHCNPTLGIRIFFSCSVLVCIACFRRSRTGIFPPLDGRWEAEAGFSMEMLSCCLIVLSSTPHGDGAEDLFFFFLF